MDDIRTGNGNRVSVVPPIRYQIPGQPVTITISGEGGTYTWYEINEPALTSNQGVILEQLRDHLIVIFRDKERYRKFLADFPREFTSVATSEFPTLDSGELNILCYYVWRDARGFGPAQPLMEDPQVSSITVNGPGRSITVHHLQYGPLSTSWAPDEEAIHSLLRKICNRSSLRVDIDHLPAIIPLRSGPRVHLENSGNGKAMRFTIIKAESEEKKPRITVERISPGQVLAEYQLYHNQVDVQVSRNAAGKACYRISMKPISEEESSAIESAKEENFRRSGLRRFREGAFQISPEDFSRVLKQRFPSIPADRHHLLYVSFVFSQDTVRWIRVILSDKQVRRIVCSHPGRSVRIWHTAAPDGADTPIIPDREDLNRFADFLIKASGKMVDADSPEVILRFRTGEKVCLTRVLDEQGHYYRVEVRKNGDISSQGKDPSPVRQPPSAARTSATLQPDDPRIDDLLTRIFTRDEREEQEEEKTGNLTGEPASVQAGFADRFLSPLREGLKVFSLPGMRKEKPERDEPPLPDTKQVPSVLSVQTEDGYTAEEAYWLFDPHAYAVIVQDPNKDRSYRVLEPELSARERIILEETHETLRDVLVYDKPVTRGDLFLEYGEVAKVVRTYDPTITDDRLSVLYYYLRRNLNGYGKIDALMYDELLEDISCNGHNLPVYIHHRYYGSIPTSIRFESEELNRFVLKLSQKADKQVSLTSPLLDASLPNGSRAQITYSDVVSTKGSSFTIRKFRSDPMTPATLLAFGTYSDELLAFIWLALENRQSLIVVGGTASGKTSAMNAFSFFIPHNSKIVSLEDTREIQIPQKNWLPVQTRASNTANDRGSVDLFDLLKASLRQRPEYIIVGEVRGNEAQTLFQAMNSGHTTLSTLHAGNIEEALNRLTNEPINVPPAMFGALNLMVIQTFHYRGGKMIRRCDAIHEIVLGEGDKVNWNTLFEYNPKDDSFRKVYSHSKTLQTIQYMHNWSEEEIQYHLQLRAGFLARLRNQYSTDPEILIRMIADLRRMA